jgi:hypothetical protein
MVAAALRMRSMTGKLSRKQVVQALDTVPLEQLFSIGVSRELTHKQKTFAREVAKGSTKADSFRTAYNPKASKAVLSSKPYHLASDVRIKAEIEAYKLALQAQEYQSPAALRALVIQSLVQVVIDPTAKQATKVAAAKVLGTVTEVAAFTERKEITTIKHSADARAQVLEQIRAIMRAQSIDAVDVDADSLLAELDPHPPATPPNAIEESLHNLHTIPHEAPQDSHESPEEDPNSPEHPPLSSEQKGVGGI